MSKTPVGEIIERSTLVGVAPSATVKEAVNAMAGNHCGSVVVLEDEAVVGIFTERDLMLRIVKAGRDPAATAVAEVMTKSPDTIEATAPVADAIRAMDEFSYRYLPVTDNGRCVGVISARHLPFSEVLAMDWELEARHRLAEQLR